MGPYGRWDEMKMETIPVLGPALSAGSGRLVRWVCLEESCLSAQISEIFVTGRHLFARPKRHGGLWSRGDLISPHAKDFRFTIDTINWNIVWLQDLPGWRYRIPRRISHTASLRTILPARYPDISGLTPKAVH